MTSLGTLQVVRKGGVLPTFGLSSVTQTHGDGQNLVLHLQKLNSTSIRAAIRLGPQGAEDTSSLLEPLAFLARKAGEIP